MQSDFRLISTDQIKIQRYRTMKTISQWKDIEQYHSKCVCQTCTCHKHKCPHQEVYFPIGEMSSYQNDFHPHPINTWQKPPPEQPRPYQPYGGISSSYQNQYPGHKPVMREKLKPRVKDESRDLPFDGDSEYKKNFGPKKVEKEPIKIKDRMFTPDNTPFIGESTYKGSYPKKMPNKHDKKIQQEYSFPDGYGFDGSTTYGKSFQEKPLEKAKSYKPEERVAPKGFHDLSSIYRDDFKNKEMPEPCPITKMPNRPSKVHHPHQHLIYNKNSMKWEEK